MWAVLRRVLAGIGLLVAAAGFAGFAAAAVEAWRLKAEADRRTEALAGQARAALGAADHTLHFVREVIDKGQTELDAARARAAATPQERVNPFLQLTARKASEDLAGSVERANAAVVTAADAAVVAEAALELFGSDEQMPELKGWLGVKPEQLAQTRQDLDAAGRELKNVRALLGVSPDAVPTAEQLMTVGSALDQARGFTDQMGRVVGGARARVDETKREVDLWALRLAAGVTAAGALGALGQFFMARFCWRVLRGKPA
jgi:hypothetical protein